MTLNKILETAIKAETLKQTEKTVRKKKIKQIKKVRTRI